MLNKFFRISSWFFAIMAFIFGLFTLFGDTFIAGILFVILGLIVLPPFTKKFITPKLGSKVTWISPIAFIVLFFVTTGVFASAPSQIVKQAELKAQSLSKKVVAESSKLNSSSTISSSLIISSVISSSISSPSSSVVTILPIIKEVIQSYPSIQPEPIIQQVTQIVEDDKESGFLLNVQKVIDGDTIKVSEVGKLRLIGIDTPELKDPRKPVQCFAIEASNKAKELLNSRKVYLAYNPTENLDKYNRTLAYVFREDGLDFNAEMIKTGYAQSYTKYPHPRLEEFVKYGQEAREKKLGLWSDSTCSGNVNQQYTEPKKEVVVAPLPVPVIKNEPKPKIIEEPILPVQPITSNLPFFPNCKEYRANGIFNITRDDPRYKSILDGDKDGFACEPEKK